MIIKLNIFLKICTKHLGGRVSCYPEHGGHNQHWRMDGHHIVSEESGLVLDILNNNSNPGALVSVWTKGHHNQNQMWTIQ